MIALTRAFIPAGAADRNCVTIGSYHIAERSSQRQPKHYYLQISREVQTLRMRHYFIGDSALIY